MQLIVQLISVCCLFELEQVRTGHYVAAISRGNETRQLKQLVALLGGLGVALYCQVEQDLGAFGEEVACVFVVF